MKKIGLLSDTHHTIVPEVFRFFEHCDEIWHAGDIGTNETLSQLQSYKPTKAVYGNMDGLDIRYNHPEVQIFSCEKVKVVMMHIGGYPNHYSYKAKQIIQKEKPQLFISGHSHILKVMYDKQFDLLHMNPGAAGKSGYHKSITMLRFAIEDNEIKDLEVFDKKR